MGHVLTMCIRDIDQAFTFKAIGVIHMPLFFFISGFFTYKSSDNKTFIQPRLKQKFIQLILPILTVGSLWVLYFPHSGLDSPLKPGFIGFWTDLWKNGYWFTLCLFELMLIYWVVALILPKIKSIAFQFFIVTLFWIVIAIAVSSLPEHFSNTIGLSWLYNYYPIFMIGIYAKKYNQLFFEQINRQPTITSSIIIAAISLYIVCYPWEFDWLNGYIYISIKVLFQISLAMIAIIFTKSCVKNSPNNKSVNIICYIGKNSLAIYLLHYFFLFPMGFLQNPLRDMGLGIVPTTTIAFITAVVIIIFVLLLNNLLNKSKLLSLIFLGKKS